jgi:lipoprotein NlpD
MLQSSSFNTSCPPRRRLGAALVFGMALLIGGCASSSRKAPVEERSATRAPATAVQPALADLTPKPLPGAENAGKPGYYTVKPGDTMIRIGLETGQNWRDVARWNGIENPNLIEVGQVLRVAPPGVDAGAVAAKPVAVAKVEAKPLDAPRAPAANGASSAPAASAPAPTSGPAVSAPAAARDGDDDIAWAWPASGSVLSQFDEARNKGIAISGKLGDPVLAAADGRVVYAGSGLRGYGNLIIVKHNNTYLTAYAHNKALLVGDDQPVKRGQKIAEMGASDAERVQLHFEIRRSGKPIDPLKSLPPR